MRDVRCSENFRRKRQNKGDEHVVVVVVYGKGDRVKQLTGRLEKLLRGFCCFLPVCRSVPIINSFFTDHFQIGENICPHDPEQNGNPCFLGEFLQKFKSARSFYGQRAESVKSNQHRKTKDYAGGFWAVRRSRSHIAGRTESHSSNVDQDGTQRSFRFLSRAKRHLFLFPLSHLPAGAIRPFFLL